MEYPAIIQRIDHVLIRVSDTQPIISFFREALGLPEAWPVTPSHPIFRSGGIRLGNVNLEIIQVGESPPEPRLYGIAFQLTPLSDSLRELERRRIPHTPPVPFLVEEQGKTVTAWNNVYLGKLMGSNPWMDLFFWMARFTPQRAWAGASRLTPVNQRIRLPLVFDRVYRNYLTMSVDFNPDWYHSQTEYLPEELGGPLGIQGLEEIIIGATHLAQARQCWQNLLDPLKPVRPDTWRLECGVTLRLISDAKDEIKAIVLRVRSVDQVRQTLLGRQLLGASTPRQVAISPQRISGLDIRLTEGHVGED